MCSRHLVRCSLLCLCVVRRLLVCYDGPALARPSTPGTPVSGRHARNLGRCEDMGQERPRIASARCEVKLKKTPGKPGASRFSAESCCSEHLPQRHRASGGGSWLSGEGRLAKPAGSSVRRASQARKMRGR